MTKSTQGHPQQHPQASTDNPTFLEDWQIDPIKALEDRLAEAEAGIKVAQATIAIAEQDLKAAIAKANRRQKALEKVMGDRFAAVDEDRRAMQREIQRLEFTLEEEVENLEDQIFGLPRQNLIKVAGQVVDGNKVIAAKIFLREDDLGQGIALKVPGLQTFLEQPCVDAQGMITNETVWIFQDHPQFTAIAKEWDLIEF